MNEQDFPIRILRPLPLAFFAAVAVATGLGITSFIYPGHGRIFFFSTLMSSIAVYSSLDLVRDKIVLGFLVTYIIAHLALCFLSGLRDDAYYGILLLPLAIADYLGFVYGAYFIYHSRSR